MSLNDDVTAWIDGMRQGDGAAAHSLWERYFTRLVELADRRLPQHARRSFDEEDVALSAFRSFCRGVEAGRFPQLSDRENLWALMIVITARKARARLRAETAQKRGGGRVQGESVFAAHPAAGAPAAEGIAQAIGREPTPEFAVEVSEQVERLLGQLPDDVSRQLAILKLEGFTNQEAARQLDCSQTTIERRLRLIRKVWSQDVGD